MIPYFGGKVGFLGFYTVTKEPTLEGSGRYGRNTASILQHSWCGKW
jgi:hypothetical protein